MNQLDSSRLMLASAVIVSLLAQTNNEAGTQRYVPRQLETLAEIERKSLNEIHPSLPANRRTNFPMILWLSEAP